MNGFKPFGSESLSTNQIVQGFVIIIKKILPSILVLIKSTIFFQHSHCLSCKPNHFFDSIILVWNKVGCSFDQHLLSFDFSNKFFIFNHVQGKTEDYWWWPYGRLSHSSWIFRRTFNDCFNLQFICCVWKSLIRTFFCRMRIYEMEIGRFVRLLRVWK